MTTHADPDGPGRLTGEARAVREVFDQVPVLLVGLEGPEHRVIACNEVYRTLIGRTDLLGATVRELWPEVAGQRIYEVLDRAYATGEAQTGREWRVQLSTESGPLEIYFDFVITPRRRADGTLAGVTMHGMDATERVRERQAAQERTAEAQRRYEQARGMVDTLQEALLPSEVPLLPTLRLAARYLLADADTAAGGDWFDTVVLGDGRVGLIAGDVVGHGVQASAVMGQLRTVVHERLRAGAGPAQVLQAVSGYAAHVPGGQAATCCVTVVDPESGELCYAGAGHPPPLLVSPDGSTRFLPAPGPGDQGPLATGSTYAAGRELLPEGGLLLLYTDGIIERPGSSPQQASRDLAQVVAATALDQAFPHDSPEDAVERTLEQSLELLLRESGHRDDITLLAAHRSAAPEEFELVLPATREAVRNVQFELGQWLLGLGCREDDENALQHAVVELVTNAVEHAYAGPGGPAAGPRDVTVRGRLAGDGAVELEVVDRGRWQPAHSVDPYRGHGLAMVEQFTDGLRFDRGEHGTTAHVGRPLHRAVSVTAAAVPAWSPAREELRVVEEPDTPDHLLVSGTVDATNADTLARHLLAGTHGGTTSLTVDLSAVTHLASAGVQVLHRVTAGLARHDQSMTLYAPAASVAAAVLELASLPYTTRDPLGP